MKRRKFFKALGGLGLAILTPTLTAKELTIDDFGAKDTSCISSQYIANKLCPNNIATKSYVDYMMSGITWHAPSDWFPKEAEIGYAFKFEPKTYYGVEIDETTKYRLEGCYTHTENGWCLLGV